MRKLALALAASAALVASIGAASAQANIGCERWGCGGSHERPLIPWFRRPPPRPIFVRPPQMAYPRYYPQYRRPERWGTRLVPHQIRIPTGCEKHLRNRWGQIIADLGPC